MVKITPFYVEEWMDRYETQASHNLAETCCASISLDQLCALSEDKHVPMLNFSQKMTYGEIVGLKQLRVNLANFYSAKAASALKPDNILITPGAIMANHLVFYTLVGPGDHVICQHPTYQQLYDTPKSLGADVDLWKCRPENNWIGDIDELKQLIRPNTKLIVVNNPQNPTGAIISKGNLEKLIAIASAHGITILSDEVYRPIFHGIDPTSKDFPPSILSMGYENCIAVGSMSKGYSLAGIRTGWIASRSSGIISQLADARHYTTIAVSQLDSAVAAYALSPHTIHALIGRNLALAKTNLVILEQWIVQHKEICEWVKPVAGTTAFVKFSKKGQPVDSKELCRKLVEDTGVLWVPGSHAFGAEFAGYVRLGYVCETQTLIEGLEKAAVWLASWYSR